MRAVDQVLSHMDEKLYDIKGYTTLEKLVHSLHMQETWANAAIAFQNLTHQPPSKRVCECALDIDRNGVMDMLSFIATQIRQDTFFQVSDVNIKGKGYASWCGNLYDYHFTAVDKSDLKEMRAHGPKEKIPRLDSEKSWKRWRTLMMTMMVPSDTYEVALYLYCALTKEPQRAGQGTFGCCGSNSPYSSPPVGQPCFSGYCSSGGCCGYNSPYSKASAGQVCYSGYCNAGGCCGQNSPYSSPPAGQLCFGGYCANNDNPTNATNNE